MDSFRKKLGAFKSNLQDDFCLVEAAEQKILVPVGKAAAASIHACLHVAAELLCKSHQSLNVLQVLGCLRYDRAFVPCEEFFHIDRLIFLLSFRIVSIEERPVRYKFAYWEPWVIERRPDLNHAQGLLQL